MTTADNTTASEAGRVRFSIIVPVRNTEATIERTLQSIVEQDHKAVEVIVIDGASTDRTVEKIDRFRPYIEHLVSEPDQGLYDAINKGLDLATGDVIGILNGDDCYAHPRVLTLYAERFVNPRVDLVYADLEFFPEGDPNRVVRRYSSRRFRPARLRFGWMPPHPTVYIRHEAYQRIGRYQTDYAISADYEFLVRAFIVHGLQFERIDEVVVRMQHGGLSTSGLKAIRKLNGEIIRACRENGLYTNWLFLLLKGPAKLAEYLPVRN